MISFLLFACTTSDLDYSTALPGKTQEPCTPADAGSYARNTPEKLVGVKVFTMEEDLQSIRSADEIKSLGLNTASISFAIPYDEQGNLRYPFNPYGEKYSSVDDTICRIGNLVHEMKSAGLNVYLSGEPHYYNPTDGEPPPALTEFEDPAVIENFQSQVLPVMEELAKMAEKYKVEYVAPISEPDKYLGAEASNTLMQNILPAFSDFQGKKVWQVYGEAFYELDVESYRFSFTGYDTLGYAVLGCDSPRYDWDNYINTLWTWAQEDGVPEAFHAEFGCVMQPSNQTEALANLQYWYDMTSSYSKGVVVLDNPKSIPNSQTFKGTWVEEWLVSIAQ